MVVLWLFFTLYWWIKSRCTGSNKPNYRSRSRNNNGNSPKAFAPFYANQKKPDWARLSIIELKAQLSDSGCRQVAGYFNRMNAYQNISVGKTYVANVLKQHQYEILHQRRKIKNKPPYPVAKNKYWGIDLTFYTDEQALTHTILGICEHHSRMALTLEKIKDKSSITTR